MDEKDHRQPGKDFRRAVLPLPRERMQTRAEIERLEAQSPQPRSDPRLTIGGKTEQRVHTELEKERRKRIEDARRRLAEDKDRARDDFERAR